MFGISSVHEKTKQNKKTRHFFTILGGNKVHQVFELFLKDFFFPSRNTKLLTFLTVIADTVLSAG